jgi:hypothetical protein
MPARNRESQDRSVQIRHREPAHSTVADAHTETCKVERNRRRPSFADVRAAGDYKEDVIVLPWW